MVVVEKSAKSSFDLDFAQALSLRPADELVSNSRVTALVFVVNGKPCDGSIERCLPQEDHSIEALALDGSDESLGEGVHVRCLVSRQQDLNA